MQLAAALAQLRSGGGGGGFNPVGTLKRVTGLDRLRFNGEDRINNRGMSVSAGKYITRGVFVQLTTDAQGYTATQIEIALTRALSLLSSVQTVGSQNFAVQLRRDY